MITDWRGKELRVGDTVVFTRGSTNRGFATGNIIEFLDKYDDSYVPEPGLLVEIVEETWRYYGDKDKRRPSRIKLRHATKVEP